MSEELKPCPFCGGERQTLCAIDGTSMLRCCNCGAMVHVAGGTLAEAATKWNRMADVNDSEERIETDGRAPVKTCRLEKLAGDYDRAAVSDSGHSVIFARFRCSECGRVFWFDKHGEIAYCPKCGAKDVWPR